MPPSPPELDRSRLLLEPLAKREHDLDLSCVLPLQPVAVTDQSLKQVGRRVVEARRKGAAVVLMMGAHVLRSGVQRHLIDLMERGWLSCLAMNGAGAVHDFELALIGATTESVSRYIADGRFGMWAETGRLNEIVKHAAQRGLGLGEAVGEYIERHNLPHKALSLLAAAWRSGCPATVHVGIGCDIVHQHPNCDGAAYGQASYRDFLRLAEVIRSLEGGVVMNFGSAVTAPEVYLKALSMGRNLARQEGGSISRFTTLVCDLVPLPTDYRQEPPRSSPGYYFRPWKTMLVRTVADGGESFYVCGRHADTLPQLWSAINQAGVATDGSQDRQPSETNRS